MLKEYKINLSKYLNSKLKCIINLSKIEIDDILLINETTKLHI